eukprot:scaffold196124_cov28-Tisochrysis_lutea.AAC.3
MSCKRSSMGAYEEEEEFGGMGAISHTCATVVPPRSSFGSRINVAAAVGSAWGPRRTSACCTRLAANWARLSGVRLGWSDLSAWRSRRSRGACRQAA